MSGIIILNAKYGAGTQVVDVTASVTAHIHQGTLNMPVSADAFNVTDPSPGNPKQVTVSYTINSGATNTLVENDGGTIFISAPAATSADGLVITKAEYGYTGNYTDVTDAINAQVSGGSINLTVGPSTAGIPDPNPNKQKSLKVEYTLNGSKNSDTVKDGATFSISAPAGTQSSGKSPTDYVGNLIWMIFKSVFYFFLTFLQSLSVFIAYNFGKTSISPFLWAGIAFFMPMFSFWGLPFYVFVARIFSSQSVLPTVSLTTV